MANLHVMTVVGPKDPYSPMGPWRKVSKYGAASCQCREFLDGYMYLFAYPLGEENWLYPRPKLIRILAFGSAMGAFEADDHNYMGFWFPRERHERVFPEGPPRYRDHSGSTLEQAHAEASKILDPWTSIPGGSTTTQDLKIIEIAKMVDSEGIV